MAKKIAVILFVFVGFYMAAHYYIRWKNTVTDNVTKVKKIIPCEPNDVQSIRFSGPPMTAEGVGEMEIVRVDQKSPGVPPILQFEQSEWKISGSIQREADQVLTTGIVAKICEIYDPIPTKEEEFTQAGGMKSKVSAKMKVGEAESEWKLEFTDLTKDRLVVMKISENDESPKFYKTAAKLSQLISLASKDYVNTRLMRMSADAINRVSVHFSRGESFQMERNGEGWDLKQGDVALGAGNEESVRFVNRFTTLKATKVNYEELNPGICDPDRAKARVQMEGLNGRQELLSFDYGKTGDIKACNSQRVAIFTIHRDFVKFLETPVKKMVGGSASKPATDQKSSQASEKKE